jgi:hypothetical protein
MSHNTAAGRPNLAQIAAWNPGFEFNPEPDHRVNDLLIDTIFVKVKMLPQFRGAEPSMSQCLLELPIDFPSIGLDPQAQRNFFRNTTPLIL